MKKLSESIDKYKKELEKGDIQVAYATVVKFVMRMKTDLTKNMSNSYTFGNVLQGYMDYTYFYFLNDYLKQRKLKFALVLNHKEMRFEVWLLGQTIDVQEKYWLLLKNSRWNQDRSEMPQYSILEAVLEIEPDFDNQDKLSKQIESEVKLVTVEILDQLKKTK
jgi:hypothetical protein